MVVANNLADYAKRVTLIRRCHENGGDGIAAEAAGAGGEEGAAVASGRGGTAKGRVEPRVFADSIQGDETEPVEVEGVECTELRWDPADVATGANTNTTSARGIEGVLVGALARAHGQSAGVQAPGP